MLHTKHLQLNNITFNRCKIDFFEISQFHLRQATALHLQTTRTFHYFPANTFLRAIVRVFHKHNTIVNQKCKQKYAKLGHHLFRISRTNWCYISSTFIILYFFFSFFLSLSWTQIEILTAIDFFEQNYLKKPISFPQDWIISEKEKNCFPFDLDRCVCVSTWLGF